jgi:hypothetical protein
LGGAGVARPLSLFKHLLKYGIDCDILTVKPVTYRALEPELLNGLDQSKIYRSGSFDPQRLMYMMGIRTVKDQTADESRKFAKSFFPDTKVRWVSKAVRLGRTLVENKRYNVIISTSPPISSHLVAKKLSNEFKIPWIGDFRDVWTAYTPEQWYDSKRLIKKANKLLSEIVESADAITGINESILNYLGKGHLIYNSFDSKLSKLWTEPSNPNIFTIGLLGTIDHLTPVEPLFKLLKAFKAVYPNKFNKIQICQVGRINLSEFDNLVEKYQLNEIIKIHRLKDRETTIKLLNESAVFYLGINQDLGKHLTTGRIFDMLASGREIIASAPDNSEIAMMINNKKCGFLFSDNNLSAAVEYINQKIIEYKADEIKPLPDYAVEHSSENMVYQFVDVINKLIHR